MSQWKHHIIIHSKDGYNYKSFSVTLLHQQFGTVKSEDGTFSMQSLPGAANEATRFSILEAGRRLLPGD